MPGTLLGSTPGTSYPAKRPDRWLNFLYAWPPESNIRDREDSPGARNPYNLWGWSSIVGGEELGMWPLQIETYDDDIRLGGTKAYSFNIRGQCLDTIGAVVQGATVELWQTTPTWVDSHSAYLIATTLSDAGGFYGFAVNDTTTNYFIVAYISTKGGVTVRNLTGAA